MNIHGRRVNCDALERSGSGYTARHQPDFALSGDPWFRGLELKSGPDGGVFLIDWYDKQACHRREPEIWDRSNGRIYRIRGVDYEPLEPFDLEKLKPAPLVARGLLGADELEVFLAEWDERTAAGSSRIVTPIVVDSVLRRS